MVRAILIKKSEANNDEHIKNWHKSRKKKKRSKHESAKRSKSRIEHNRRIIWEARRKSREESPLKHRPFEAAFEGAMS